MEEGSKNFIQVLNGNLIKKGNDYPTGLFFFFLWQQLQQSMWSDASLGGGKKRTRAGFVSGKSFCFLLQGLFCIGPAQSGEMFGGRIRTLTQLRVGVMIPPPRSQVKCSRRMGGSECQMSADSILIPSTLPQRATLSHCSSDRLAMFSYCIFFYLLIMKCCCFRLFPHLSVLVSWEMSVAEDFPGKNVYGTSIEICNYQHNYL